MGRNKSIQSNCYKYPVIILEEDEEIPYFPYKTKNLELDQDSLNLSSRNTYWDKKLGKFVGQKYWEEDNRHQKIQTYGDYLQIMNLENLLTKDLKKN
ncbi:hypothetical protein WEN_02510 [Mycoplasma wenyonii str. Massachusetts]|uniref:Uncharacterized protein n=1 Tax=Mycoplasma wenyonii (strain Massachusetts) TaxID=1197325 RepID=I6ZFB4_MYCWM|nr:hypothetical protein [Mycoplasma wenyonii]AFN65287.1 hypothetical protein WEN_02510 [Mycoplasma wenyonii str. Massachusetts]